MNRQTLNEKIEHHRKMVKFYGQYRNALDIVESFEFNERMIIEEHDKFCSVGNCLNLISSKAWTQDDVCPKHRIIMDRRGSDYYKMED